MTGHGNFTFADCATQMLYSGSKTSSHLRKKNLHQCDNIKKCTEYTENPLNIQKKMQAVHNPLEVYYRFVCIHIGCWAKSGKHVLVALFYSLVITG